MTRLLLSSLLTLTLALTLSAADWPQWRGPDRTGISKETGLLKVWPKDGPAKVWISKEAGTGFGGPAIVGDTVYIMGALKEGTERIEYLIALDNKGAKKWAAKIGKMFDFEGNQWSAGPNATPTVDGKLIYALGSQGELICVNTE